MEAFEMVKKKTVPAEPIVSNIPIPVSDNPMVIDLPDGQKIVLGRLNPGSVIEVATWRGTGRPDSRTNRFMLGVSDGSTPVASQDSPDVSQNKAINKLQALWKRQKISNKLVAKESSETQSDEKSQTGFISRFIGGTVASVSKALLRTKDLTPIETTHDLEISAWLESISREADHKAARNSEREASGSPRKPSIAKKVAAPKKAANRKKK
jgi:hypothetical protein